MVLPAIFYRDFMQLIRSAHGLGPLFLALASAGGFFVWLLMRAEGTAETLPALWGLAASSGMPFLAAVAASRGFTHDRECGMMRLMFSTPVRARSWVLGKTLAAVALCGVYLLGLGTAYWVLFRWLLPESASFPANPIGFWLVVPVLLVQALFWCSLGTLLSLFSRSSASTFLLSLMACFLAPPLIVSVLSLFTPSLTSQWPLFPLQSMVYDCAGGIVNLRMLVGCLLSTGILVYTAGFVFDALRLYATER